MLRIKFRIILIHAEREKMFQKLMGETGLRAYNQRIWIHFILYFLSYNVLQALILISGISNSNLSAFTADGSIENYKQYVIVLNLCALEISFKFPDFQFTFLIPIFNFFQKTKRNTTKIFLSYALAFAYAICYVPFVRLKRI